MEKNVKTKNRQDRKIISIVIFFIFFLVISLNATNYSILRNKLCSVEYDKITGGYYVFFQGKPLFPNR